jgi:hypothetical protein
VDSLGQRPGRRQRGSTTSRRKDAKRLLRELGGPDPLDLDRLVARGADNGCAAFVREVQDRLVPLIQGA